MRVNSEPNHGKMKQKAKQNSTTSVGSPQNSCGNGSRFHVGDGDASWRPSFGEEIHEDKKSEGVDENVIASSSFPTGRSKGKKHGTREGTLKFKDKDSGRGEERKLVDDRKVSLEMDEYNRAKEYEKLRRRFERKAQRVLQEQLLKLEREAAKEVEFASSKVVEKDVLQFESPRTICTPRIHSFASSSELKNSNNRNIVESFEKTRRQSQKKLSPERHLKQTEELKVKTKKKKQTLDVSREPQRRKPKHSPRVRIYSPRMASKVEICKIKALEDLRRAKLKMKKEREEVVEERQGSDSFAVIKCSLDPKQDFRDSMIEMIMEKQITHPEEMEELLACYLTLNADEYHDLIIEVFRQVWFEMSRGG